MNNEMLMTIVLVMIVVIELKTMMALTQIINVLKDMQDRKLNKKPSGVLGIVTIIGGVIAARKIWKKMKGEEDNV